MQFVGRLVRKKQNLFLQNNSCVCVCVCLSVCLSVCELNKFSVNSFLISFLICICVFFLALSLSLPLPLSQAIKADALREKVEAEVGESIFSNN